MIIVFFEAAIVFGLILLGLFVKCLLMLDNSFPLVDISVHVDGVVLLVLTLQALHSVHLLRKVLLLAIGVSFEAVVNPEFHSGLFLEFFFIRSKDTGLSHLMKGVLDRKSVV